MRFWFRPHILMGAGFLISAIILISPMAAQALSVSPAKYSMTIDAGSAQVAKITIANGQTTAQSLKMSVVGAAQSPTGAPIFDSGIDEAESWVKLGTTTLALLPMSQQTIDFTITVPKGARPGSHYIGVAVEPVAPASGTVGISTRLVVLASVTVAGTVEEKLTFAAWKLDHAIWWGEVWRGQADLKNTGTVGVVADGQMVVTNLFGSVVARKPFAPATILPNTTREMDLAFSSLPLWHWPGIYRVTYVVQFGLVGQVISATTTIVYVSWVSAIIIVMIILVLVGFVYFKKNKRL